MNRFICCLFLLGLNVAGFSQKQYFVYIQAENPQPFFVKINEKVYSADAAGYLILPKLKDTAYTFKIGYPQNKWPEQQFSVAIRSKDHGFLLKQFDGKGWGLFDLQSLSVIMADDVSKDKAAILNADISGFTAILSRAANDPSLLEKPVALVKQEEKPQMTETMAIKEPILMQKEQAPGNITPRVEEGIKKNDTGIAVKQQPLKNLDTDKKAEQALVKNTGEIKNKPDTTASIEQPGKKEEAIAAVKNPEPNSTADKKLTLPKEQLPDNAVLVEQPAKKKDTALLVKKEPLKKEDTAKLAEQQKKAEQPLVKNISEPKKSDTAIVERSTKKEEALIADNNGKNKLMDPVTDAEVKYKRSVVTKRSESSTTEGLGLIFIDELSAGNRDTVQIVIPNPPNFANFIRQSEDQPATKKVVTPEPTDKDVSLIGSPAVTKKTCLLIASDNDFLKLRKKMAAQRTDESMINESKKIFKTKCFTTEQVKNLGNLFLNESGKFQFYETAYPFNSDRNNFASLQMELKDAYFIHRFKKMLN